MKLSGDRNQCAGCGEYFNSSFAFDKHRSGEHAGNMRFCLSPFMMAGKGMSKNAAGFWISAAMPEAALPQPVEGEQIPEPVGRVEFLTSLPAAGRMADNQWTVAAQPAKEE